MELLNETRKIKKSEWIAASAIAFVLVAAYCMFENRDTAFWSVPAFWFFVGTAAAFFGAAICIFAFDGILFSAAAAAVGCTVVGILCRSAAPLAFCVLLPVLVFLFALRMIPLEGTEKSVPPALPVALLAVLIAFLAGAGVFLIRGLFFSNLPFQFFQTEYNDRLYGFWPLLLLFAGTVFSCIRHIVFSGKALGENTGKTAEKRQKKDVKKRRAARNSGFPYRLISVCFLLAVSLFFIDAILCYMRLHQIGDRLIPYPILIDLSALFLFLFTLDRLRERLT